MRPEHQAGRQEQNDREYMLAGVRKNSIDYDNGRGFIGFAAIGYASFGVQ